jgi:hypothetical protein
VNSIRIALERTLECGLENGTTAYYVVDPTVRAGNALRFSGSSPDRLGETAKVPVRPHRVVPAVDNFTAGNHFLRFPAIGRDAVTARPGDENRSLLRQSWMHTETRIPGDASRGRRR